ncbi:hypothetical protein A2U01_0056132, partial [Trifolium medium]|nr:hypothetical protein [Trifolium medium]
AFSLIFAWRAPSEPRQKVFRLLARSGELSRPAAPGEKSSLSPGETNCRPAKQAQIWGSASNSALASPKTHFAQLIDP